jgi:hypothetical protein
MTADEPNAVMNPEASGVVNIDVALVGFHVTIPAIQSLGIIVTVVPDFKVTGIIKLMLVEAEDALMLATDVTLPFESTVSCGICTDEPYTPAVTEVLASVSAPEFETVASPEIVVPVAILVDEPISSCPEFSELLSSVPLVGSVTFVAPVMVNVVAKAPEVLNDPPKVIVLPMFAEPVPP